MTFYDLHVFRMVVNPGIKKDLNKFHFDTKTESES